MENINAGLSLEDKENSPNSTSNFVPPPTPLLKRIGYGTGIELYSKIESLVYSHCLGLLKTKVPNIQQ